MYIPRSAGSWIRFGRWKKPVKLLSQVVVVMNTKLSSNLIEATAGKEFSRAWMPLEFSVQIDEPAENLPQELFADLSTLPEIVTTKPDEMIDPEAAPEATTRIGLDNRPLIRRWQPDDVKVVTEAGVDRPTVKLADSPTPDDLREKILQDMMVQAGQILTNAQAQAAEIVRQAQESAQQVLLDSQQRGWKAVEEETVPMIQSVQAIIDGVQNWRDEMYSQSEAAVLNLVKDISQALFCEGIALEEEKLQQTFNKILSNARSLGDLRVFVHPEDALTLGPYWREYQVSISGQQVEIIPSDSIQRGGCFVEGQMGTVDGRVETKLKAIMTAISVTAENSANSAR
jgi:flagellar biosynthesis/type III secretory pathway protein FliH